MDPKDTCAPLPAAPCIGYVTTLDKYDLRAVDRALSTEVKMIKTAGLLPRRDDIVKFAALYPPKKPFSEVLRTLADFIRTSDIFHPCSLDDNIESAQLFDDVRLSVEDRLVFIMAPIGRDPKCRLATTMMAECIAENKDGSILNIPCIDLEALDVEPMNIGDLQRLEALHKTLIVYLWLSYRFPATFTPRETAQELKKVCEDMIERGLQAVRFTRKKLSRGRRVANAVAESLDPESMANLEDEQVEPDEHVPSAREKRALKVEEDAFKAEEEALEGKCGKCGMRGHVSADCTKPRAGQVWNS